jgi:hypothetical protein
MLFAILAGLFVLTAVPDIQGKRPVRAGSDADMDAMLDRLAAQERHFELTQAHIDFLRRLTVQYDPSMESGATPLDLHSARGTPARIATRLWDHFVVSDARKSELEASFEIFLAFAELAPGRYPVASDDVTDYQPDTPEAGRVKLPAEFQFTDEHLKLLNNANARRGRLLRHTDHQSEAAIWRHELLRDRHGEDSRHAARARCEGRSEDFARAASAVRCAICGLAAVLADLPETRVGRAWTVSTQTCRVGRVEEDFAGLEGRALGRLPRRGLSGHVCRDITPIR